jgi:hypothetical protein
MTDQDRQYVGHTYTPRELSEEDVEEIVLLVKKGGAVDTTHLRGHLRTAELVVLFHSKAELVAVGVIKAERRGYAASVARHAKCAFPTDLREIGYVSVNPQHQHKGLSHKVVEALLAAHKGDLFATTFAPWMKRTLAGHGFRQVGSEWPSKRSPGANVSLWIGTAGSSG